MAEAPSRRPTNKGSRWWLTGSTGQQEVPGLYVPRQDHVADYRRQAQDARAMASWISPNEANHQLLEVARHLEAMAEIEERAAREAASTMSPPSEARSEA
jgi:predicted MarR family transcription regulator